MSCFVLAVAEFTDESPIWHVPITVAKEDKSTQNCTENKYRVVHRGILDKVSDKITVYDIEEADWILVSNNNMMM